MAISEWISGCARVAPASTSQQWSEDAARSASHLAVTVALRGYASNRFPDAKRARIARAREKHVQIACSRAKRA